MIKQIMMGLLILLGFFGLQKCSTPEVKELDADDVLEEELRADPEPFRELKDKDSKDDSKKNTKKPIKR